MSRIEKSAQATARTAGPEWIGPGPVREAKLGEQLYNYLRDLIDSGKLAPGAKLPTEKTICENFRISRPVVREALARLRMENLISSRRGSGSYVRAEMGARHPFGSANTENSQPRQSGLSNLLRHFELRVTVESATAYYAALRRKPNHLATMRTSLEDMEAALAVRTLCHDAHFNFHLTIAEATGNSFFTNALKSMRPYMDITMNLLRDLWVLDADKPIDTGRHQHSYIYDAIAAGRAADASRAMQLHLDEARRAVFGDLGAPLFLLEPHDGRN